MSILEISIMNFFLWIAFGIVVGYLMHQRDRRRVSGGIFLTILFSVIGALTGGYLTSFLLGKAMLGLSFQGLLNAGLTALVIVAFYRSSFGNRQYIRTLSTRKG